SGLRGGGAVDVRGAPVPRARRPGRAVGHLVPGDLRNGDRAAVLGPRGPAMSTAGTMTGRAWAAAQALAAALRLGAAGPAGGVRRGWACPSRPGRAECLLWSRRKRRPIPLLASALAYPARPPGQGVRSILAALRAASLGQHPSA